uniref:ZP domain-containing protein n=1 Tax=Xenopus tropicalis TaxID=8364 RepID=A0A803JC03_XENTR
MDLQGNSAFHHLQIFFCKKGAKFCCIQKSRSGVKLGATSSKWVQPHQIAHSNVKMVAVTLTYVFVKMVSSFKCLVLENECVLDDCHFHSLCSSTNISINGTGAFSAHMAAYNSSDYKHPYEGTQIDLYTKTVIYIGVFFDGPDPSLFAMVLNNCYATPSSNPDDPIKYYIIQNRCPSTIDDTVNVAENGLSSQARFSFQMFAFAGNYNQVYLHCQIYACDSRTSACAPTCSGARALDVNMEKTFNLKLGPFKRLDSPPTAAPDSPSAAPDSPSAASGTQASWTVTVLLMLMSAVLVSGKQ